MYVAEDGRTNCYLIKKWKKRAIYIHYASEITDKIFDIDTLIIMRRKGGKKEEARLESNSDTQFI